MSIPKTFAALFLLGTAIGVPAESKSPPFQPVQNVVRERTGLSVRWQQNADARAESLAQVRTLLKRPLTASSAVQIALLNNRDLLAALEDVGVSAADLREAGMWKNPSLDLSLRLPDRAPKGPNWEEAAAFDFLDLLLRPLRQRVAANQLRAVQLRTTDQVLQLAAEVKKTVYTLEADATLLAKRQAIQEVQRAALELAQRQHEAGNITDLALAQQQAAYNAVRLETASAENEQREHREALNRLLSLWGPDTSWTISAALPALPENEVALRGLESLAVAQRLDLAAAHQDLAGMVEALGLTKRYRYLGALTFGIDTERESEGPHVTGPQLSLELPLFNQGQTRIAKGEAELRRSERKVEGLAIVIRSDVRKFHDQLTALRELCRFYESEELPVRRTITAGLLLHYNGMLVGQYELFSARADQLEAELKSIAARRDYWTTRAELERAVGGSLRPRITKSAIRKNP